MKLLQKLRESLAKALKDQEAILAKLVNADGETRSMSEEENSQYEALSSSIKDIKAQIERAKSLQEEQAEIEKTRATVSKPTITVTRNENENDAGEYRGFRHLGEQLEAIARSSRPGNKIDERLEQLHASIRAVSGMSEGVGADGGFLVQTDFQESLFQKTTEESYIASLCETVTISSNSNALEWNELVEDSRVDGSRHGGVRVYRDKEGGTVSASQVQLRRDRLVAEKLTALAYATEELLEDAAGLQSLIEPAFTKEMAYVLDEEILTGDGAGECLGILNSPATVVVAAEGGQSADTIVHANVKKMHNRLWAGSEGKAIWLIGSGVADELETLSFTPGGGTSIPVYMPANGISGKPYGTLYGASVRRNEHCSAIGDKGDILYADFSQYRLVRKGGLKGAVSQHVRFIYGENTFRWTMRVNGKPLWKKPLTPAKGVNTESPFVTLAAR